MNEPKHWPEPNYSAPPVELMHALGIASLNYNSFEHVLFAIFRVHLLDRNVPSEFSGFIFGELNRQQQIQALKEVFETCEKDPIVIERISDLLAFFSWAAQARDMLMHSHQDTFSDPKEGRLALAKRSRDNFAKFNFMSLSVLYLRAIADDMHRGYLFALNLFAFLESRAGRMPGFLSQLAPLPNKPQIPKPLKLKEAPSISDTGKPQPGSSRA